MAQDAHRGRPHDEAWTSDLRPAPGQSTLCFLQHPFQRHWRRAGAHFRRVSPVAQKPPVLHSLRLLQCQVSGRRGGGADHALFIPGYAGKQHARRAVEAGQALLRVIGHGEPGGPWVPVGVGIHTGLAWAGSIAGASGAAADFTALGDNVNIAARLASKAGPGEVLVSEATCDAARIETGGLEKRDLELKGKTELVSVRVLHAG